MAPIDKINPFLTQSTGIGQYQGGQTPRVNPFAPKVGGVEKVQGGNPSFSGFKAEKWAPGLGGLRTGALGEQGAVYSKNLGGKETRLGARLNVDAFSLA